MKSEIMTNKEIAQEIKNQLTRGDITTIAEVTGLSKVTISNHIMGKVKRPAPLILKVAIDVIKQRQKEQKLMMEKLKS